MPAILFGSISTVADTSELQRASFNEAFAQHGLDWQWEPDEYRQLLTEAGGEQRVAQFARLTGEEDVDATAVHASKSAIFQRKLAEGGVSARPGVRETIAAAKDAGYAVGLVTTTSPENVAALLGALGSEITAGSFDTVIDSGTVDRPKPAPAAYAAALDALGESPDACVAIEDNVDGVAAARAAEIGCVAFPNANTAEHAFTNAAATVDHLDFSALQEQIPSTAESR